MIKITVLKEDNGAEVVGPIMLCDICGERITDARQAQVHWLYDGDSNRIIHTHFVHKAGCNQYINRNTHWERLDVWMNYLLTNLGLPKFEVKEP